MSCAVESLRLRPCHCDSLLLVVVAKSHASSSHSASEAVAASTATAAISRSLAVATVVVVVASAGGVTSSLLLHHVLHHLLLHHLLLHQLLLHHLHLIHHLILLRNQSATEASHSHAAQRTRHAEARAHAEAGVEAHSRCLIHMHLAVAVASAVIQLHGRASWRQDLQLLRLGLRQTQKDGLETARAEQQRNVSVGGEVCCQGAVVRRSKLKRTCATDRLRLNCTLICCQIGAAAAVQHRRHRMHLVQQFNMRSQNATSQSVNAATHQRQHCVQLQLCAHVFSPIR